MPERPIVGVIMATLLEAEPFIEALGMEKVQVGPLVAYRQEGVVLVVSGIGKVNAAVATAACCTLFRPHRLLNLGAAGATGPSHPMGEICHITKVIEYDRPHFRGHGPHVHKPEVLPGFREATLATQDRAVLEAGHRREVSAAAELVDMEGSAVVQTGHRLGIGCVLFKFVSDTPELPSGHGDIVECIKQYRIPFCRFVLDWVMPILREDQGEG